MRKNWGARVNILRERIGRGDVLKPNIDMGDKTDRTAETLSRGSTSIHRWTEVTATHRHNTRREPHKLTGTRMAQLKGQHALLWKQ